MEDNLISQVEPFEAGAEKGKEKSKEMRRGKDREASEPSETKELSRTTFKSFCSLYRFEGPVGRQELHSHLENCIDKGYE